MVSVTRYFRKVAASGPRALVRSTALAVCLGLAAIAHAQRVLPRLAAPSESQLKAEAIFNFLKFVEWPAETFQTPTQSVLICVMGHGEIADILEEGAHKQVVGQRTVVIQPGFVNGPGCNILFVPRSGKARHLAEEIKAGPILTVGEEDGFTSEGGIVRIRVAAGRVLLEINVKAADRARLRVSSKLLWLPSVVRK